MVDESKELVQDDKQREADEERRRYLESFAECLQEDPGLLDAIVLKLYQSEKFMRKLAHNKTFVGTVATTPGGVPLLCRLSQYNPDLQATLAALVRMIVSR